MATKRVRIAVVIDENGNWYATGSSISDDVASSDLAKECFTPKGEEVVRYVEAEVPYPDMPTIEGKVI